MKMLPNRYEVSVDTFLKGQNGILPLGLQVSNKDTETASTDIDKGRKRQCVG